MIQQPEFISLQRQNRLSAQAAEQIAQMILSGQYAAGDHLPSERQLAEALGVSRTVVREAIRLLEARRLVSVQTGSGAVVMELGSAPVTDSLNMLLQAHATDVSFDDLQVVRGVLEVATAGLAAHCATAEDRAGIREAFERMQNADSVPEQIQADYDFHLRVAQATHNQVFVLFLQALNDVLVHTWRQYWRIQTGGTAAYLAADQNTDQKESNQFHGQVMQAIEQGNELAARQAMAQMLQHWSFMYAGVAPASQTD